MNTNKMDEASHSTKIFVKNNTKIERVISFHFKKHLNRDNNMILKPHKIWIL